MPFPADVVVLLRHRPSEPDRTTTLSGEKRRRRVPWPRHGTTYPSGISTQPSVPRCAPAGASTTSGTTASRATPSSATVTPATAAPRDVQEPAARRRRGGRLGPAHVHPRGARPRQRRHGPESVRRGPDRSRLDARARLRRARTWPSSASSSSSTSGSTRASSRAFPTSLTRCNPSTGCASF